MTTTPAPYSRFGVAVDHGAETRYLTPGGALSTDIENARRYKNERDAKSDAKSMNGRVVPLTTPGR